MTDDGVVVVQVFVIKNSKEESPHGTGNKENPILTVVILLFFYFSSLLYIVGCYWPYTYRLTVVGSTLRSFVKNLYYMPNTACRSSTTASGKQRVG